MSVSTYPTNQQRRMLWGALTALAVISLVGVAAVAFWGFIAFLSWSYPILLPIGLAVIVALVLEPIVAFIQRRGMNRGAATLLVCVLAVFGVLFFWAFLGNTIYSQTSGFFKDLPGMLNNSVTKLEDSLAAPPEKSPLQLRTAPTAPAIVSATNQLALAAPPARQSLEFPLAVPEPTSRRNDLSQIQAWLKNNLPTIQQEVEKNIANLIYSVLGPVGQALGFLLGFGFVPIYVYYFLADQDNISKHWHELVPMRQSRWRDEVVAVIGEINQSLVGYFRGQIVVAGVNGVLTFIGLWVIGVPYSLALGVITGALSIVPFLGIIASIIPALLLGFLSAKDDSTLQWLRPLLVLVVFAVVQMSESMFVTPRVQSHSTGLHPLAIILGILFWSMLLPGLLGPVVAVPLTCALVVLLRRYVWIDKRRTKNHERPVTD
jgi:predicted PurR-regulated permease PerM